MKILILAMFTIIFVASTMAFASAQVTHISVTSVSAFGNTGVGNGRLSAPNGIALDSSGNIYVADMMNNRIAKFDPTGNFISSIGSEGSADGQFDYPRDVAIDQSGNIYVADLLNHRIEKFDSSGNFVLKFGTSGSGDGQFSSLSGIALDDSGNVYVADLQHPIQKFDSNGNFISEIGANQSNSTQSLTIDQSGNIYIVFGAKVVEISSSGTLITQWGSYCDVNNSQTSQEYCVDPDGSGPLVLGDGQFDAPNDIALDNSGHVYVTDAGNSRIQVFDSSGHFVYKFGSHGTYSGQFTDPNGIAVDNSGNMYVVDQNNGRVQILNIDYNSTASVSDNTVTSQSKTTTSVFASVSPSVFGQSVTFESRLYPSSASGTVVFTIDGSVQSPSIISHGVATFTTSSLSEGSHTITATYSGDTNDVTSTSQEITQIVNQPSIIQPSAAPIQMSTPINIAVKFTSLFGSPGSGDGQLSVPQGITLDKSGNIYVASQMNHRIEKFDSNGHFVSKIGEGHLSAPTNVAVDSSGNIYVVDTNYGTIEKFDSSGNFVLKFGTYGINDLRIVEPQGIAIDESGNIYVTDYSDIQKYDSSGNFVFMFGTSGMNDGQLSSTGDIVVDPSGNIYVADGNERVEKFDSSGNFVLKFGTHGNLDSQFNNIQGIALDKFGNIFVTDSGNDRVQIFDPSGNFLYTFGTSGTDTSQFAGPNGIAVDNSGNIYVADQSNARVQIFNINYDNTANVQNNVVTHSSSTTPPSTQTTTQSNTQDTTTASQSIAPQTKPATPTTTQPVTSLNTLPLTSVPEVSSIQKMPNWVKDVFYYYGQGQMSDSDLINTINFLVQQNIIQLK